MIKSINIVLMLAIITLCGCSNPKTASKSNFKKAINVYYAKHQVYLFDNSITNNFKFPAKIKVDMFSKNLITSYQALVSANILSMKDTTLEENTISFFGKGGKVTIPAKEYNITETGQKYFKAAASSNMITGDLNGFNIGQPEVIEISSYTEPSDSSGVKVSQVSYKVKVSNIPEWAKKAEVVAAFPVVKKYLEPSIDAKMVLVLNNDGWAVAE